MRRSLVLDDLAIITMATPNLESLHVDLKGACGVRGLVGDNERPAYAEWLAAVVTHVPGMKRVCVQGGIVLPALMNAYTHICATSLDTIP